MITRRTRSEGRRSTKRGSLLMPVVAAVLILLLMGVALSELFGAQRMQSALKVESTQAFTIAEAGLWHAAYDEAEITVPDSYAGGDYTVTKAAGLYTATVFQATKSSNMS